jgi:Ala-tRNA(Pro) deacylase
MAPGASRLPERETNARRTRDDLGRMTDGLPLFLAAPVGFSPAMTELPLHPAVVALPRPAARADLFAALDALGIAHATLDHPPVFTVAEGAEFKAKLPGGHTKNLFLKDKAGALALVSALGETSVPVNRLHRALGTQRFSFAKEDVLWDALGVRPGSVTVFALVNDRDRRVRMVLDAALLAHDTVNFHPLGNDATTAIARDDLLSFIRATGREPVVLDFATMTGA